MEKSDEISKLKRDVAATAATAEDLMKDKKYLEDECTVESEKKRATQIEAERFLTNNDKISKSEDIAADRLHENELEARRLDEKIELTNRQIVDTETITKQKEAELAVTLDTKKSLQLEIDNVSLTNARLQDENKGLGMKANDFEMELDRLNKRIDEVLSITEVRDKELRSSKSNLAYAEDKVAETKEQAKKMQRENEVLQALLDKYRNDVDMQKRLRDQEVSKKFEIEQDKKRLEMEVLKKDLEARSVKKELEKVQVDKDRLLDNHFQLNQELSALKEHAGVLEYQNKNVSSLSSITQQYS